MDPGGLIDLLQGGFRLENDSAGLRWTVNRVHGIQKVRGSNPLGSTRFLSPHHVAYPDSPLNTAPLSLTNANEASADREQ